MTPPSTYDAAFRLHGHGIPVDYLRALAWSESGLRADARAKGSTATGLFQILRPTWDDYERRHGYPGLDRTNPDDATELAADLLDQVTRAYAAAGLPPDWPDREYARLVTLGYKAGWSRQQGVAHALAALPRSSWDAESVVAQSSLDFPRSHIWATGDGGYMSDPALLAAVDKVADAYLGSESSADAARTRAPGAGAGGAGSGAGWLLLLGLAAGAGLAWSSSKGKGRVM